MATFLEKAIEDAVTNAIGSADITGAINTAVSAAIDPAAIEGSVATKVNEILNADVA